MDSVSLPLVISVPGAIFFVPSYRYIVYYFETDIRIPVSF